MSSARRATLDELLPLRWAVLRPGRPLADARWPGDEHAQHWLLEEQGRTVAVLSLFPTPWPEQGASWQLRGMAVEPARQGQGLGRALLEAAQQALGAPMWCNARTGAAPFYLRGGWQPVGEVFEIHGVGPHLRMVWRPGA